MPDAHASLPSLPTLCVTASPRLCVKILLLHASPSLILSNVEKMRAEHIEHPFSEGECYQDVVKRVKTFLHDVSRDGTIMIIGHRATQYAIEHLVNGIPLKTIVLYGSGSQDGPTIMDSSIPPETIGI